MTTDETDLSVGKSSITAYSRLSYTMWHALAEFIDNSTQSRLNYGSLVDEALRAEGTPLVVDIVHNRVTRELTIRDNSIGMTKEDLKDALQIAKPTKDSMGRSKYGMGMKTAACWIGKRWKVITTELTSTEEWTADVNVKAIADETARVPLTMCTVDANEHYTILVISEMHRQIQTRTEETIRAYLGSMYRNDIQKGRLKLTFNGTEVTLPEKYEFDTDEGGRPRRQEFSTTIGDKPIKGWFGVLQKGGRKYGGFSLFQNDRQIQGFPNAWKPNIIFGGVDVEGANNLVAQRLTGVIELDGFDVSHTKDAILFQGNEEEELEKYLEQITRDYRNYAQRRRGTRGTPWTKEKLQELANGFKQEFASPELKDALDTAVLPPLETITDNNRRQVASLTTEDKLATLEVSPALKVIFSVQMRSEHDPHLTIDAGAEAGTIYVIINGLHPYYSQIESPDAVEECMRQYLYDAIAEYKVSKLSSRLSPESIRRLKNDLLKAQIIRIENRAAAERDAAAPPRSTPDA